MPWGELVDELRRQQDISSQDDLAYEARRHGAPSTLTGSWLSAIRRGKRPLREDVLKGLAGALGVPPEIFTEYRLAIARRALDERSVGLDQAHANLDRVSDLLGEDLAEAEGLAAEVEKELADAGRASDEKQSRSAEARGGTGD